MRCKEYFLQMESVCCLGIIDYKSGKLEFLYIFEL